MGLSEDVGFSYNALEKYQTGFICSVWLPNSSLLKVVEQNVQKLLKHFFILCFLYTLTSLYSRKLLRQSVILVIEYVNKRNLLISQCQWFSISSWSVHQCNGCWDSQVVEHFSNACHILRRQKRRSFFYACASKTLNELHVTSS